MKQLLQPIAFLLVAFALGAFSPLTARAAETNVSGYVCSVLMYTAREASGYGTGGSIWLTVRSNADCTGTPSYTKHVCSEGAGTYCDPDSMYSAGQLQALFQALVQAKIYGLKVTATHNTTQYTNTWMRIIL